MSLDADAQDGLFGRLAVHRRAITLEQLAQATALQAQRSDRPALPALLVELGFLSTLQVDDIVKQQRDVLERRLRDERERAAAAPRPIDLGSGRAATALQRAQTLALSVDVVEELRHELRQARAPAPPPTTTTTTTPATTTTTTTTTTTHTDPLAEARTFVQAMLAAAVEQDASDLHIHADEPVRMRRFGALVPVTDRPLPAALTSMALRALLPSSALALLDKDGHADCAISVPGVGRFRLNAYRQIRGVDGVFRVIKARPPTLSELNLPPTLARLTTYHQGIVLLTGPAACGKSATMAALVHMVNEERAEHVVTIEDPIEVLHPSIRCVVNQREARRHTKSFATALRSALREDPDVIVIGEMRDRETAQLALTAAETGHLVFATLHTHSATRTINRVIGEFPPAQQPAVRAMLSESLRAIVSQRLLPKRDGSGVVPAVEVLLATPAVQNLIRDSRVHQIRSTLQTSAALGMQTLDAALADLVARGVVDVDVARREADDPRALLAPGGA